MFKGLDEFLYSYLVAHRISGKLDILRVLNSLSGQFRQMSPSELHRKGVFQNSLFALNTRMSFHKSDLVSSTAMVSER